jgi:hydroxylamine dehydrogenase
MRPNITVSRFEAVKSLDLAHLTEASWPEEREKMIRTCHRCHSERYSRQQLEMGDSIMTKADRLLAAAIETVAAPHKDGIIVKPDNYAIAYPNLLYFMRVGRGNME